MRSRTEAGFAQWLDRLSIPWAYEPDVFSGSTGQWLPDFRIRVDLLGVRGPRKAFVEVKPQPPQRSPDGWNGSASRRNDFSEHFGLFRRMSVVWESDPHALLLFAYRQTDEDPHATIGVMRPNSAGIGFPWPATWCEPLEPGGPPVLDYWGTSRSSLERRDAPWFGQWWKEPAPADSGQN